MAKRCTCHRDRAAAVAAGMDWHKAHARFGKPGYHEHRCECPCGCSHDTQGYAHCVPCSWDRGCWERRQQVGVTVLGLPVDAPGGEA